MAKLNLLNPFAFSNWLFTAVDHDKEDQEPLEVGVANNFPEGTKQPNAATVLGSRSPGNATFAASNQDTGTLSIGLYGESQSARGVGIVGASANAGVIGVGIGGLGTTNVLSPPLQGTGVSGIGRHFGVHGSSNGGTGVFAEGGTAGVSGRGAGVGVFGLQTTLGSPPNPAESRFSKAGVVGIGDARGGIFLGDSPAGAGLDAVDVFPGEPLANIQLIPVTSGVSHLVGAAMPPPDNIPTFPLGATGDMILIQMMDGPQKKVAVGVPQLWLCIKGAIVDPNGGGPPSPATWARVNIDFQVTV